MIDTWIFLAIAAAFFQNLRSAIQKHLKGKLSTLGAAYARFLFALPVSAVYLWGLHQIGDFEFPQPNSLFFVYCALGGASQILFTVCLLWLFSFKSFAVGTTFSKLEVIMVVLLSALFLGETLSAIAIFAIVLSASGVIALGLGQENMTVRTMLRGLGQKSTMIGLVCAVWLGGSSVFYRGASLSLGHDQFVMAAAYTLTISLVIQTLLMGLYILYKESGQITKVLVHWQWAGTAGVAGALASIAWFTAFTIQSASYVRAVGQIELVFTFFVTTLIFKEKVSRSESLGIVLVTAGIIILLAYA